MLEAVEYIGRVGVGVTSPSLIKGDDGFTYVVKMQNNRLGTKVLVNEYIAAWLGRQLELPFPFGACIRLSDEFVAQNRRRFHRRAKAGIHFASRYLKGAKYVHYYHMPQVTNKAEFAGVILFDHLFLNEDRTLNGKNLLICREANGYRMQAIDNSHLFGSGRWVTENLASIKRRFRLNQRRAYGALLKRDLCGNDFACYIARFKALDDGQIRAAMDGIPKEWGMQAADLEAIVDFIQYRREMVERIAARIIDSIPNIHRGIERDDVK